MELLVATYRSLSTNYIYNKYKTYQQLLGLGPRHAPRAVKKKRMAIERLCGEITSAW